MHDALPGYVCQDHQKDRCQKGDTCKHWHIGRDFLKPVWCALDRVSNCCGGHGDPASHCPSFSVILQRSMIEVVFEDHSGPRIFVVPDVFGNTHYWDLLTQFPIQQPLSVRSKRVCRLHHHQRCSRASECGNAHICHRAWTVCLALRSLAPGLAFLVTLNAEGSPMVTSGAAWHFQTLLAVPRHSVSLVESLGRLRHSTPKFNDED